MSIPINGADGSRVAPAEKNRSIIALDLLRGLAALEVFFRHARGASFVEYSELPRQQHTVLIEAFYTVTRMGHEAVMVFFVLSGYLVFGSVLRRSSEGRFKLSDYIVDRTTRIFLPLIPACIFAAVVARVFDGSPWEPGQVLANMFGLNGIFAETMLMNTPLWTLAYEIWFYVVAGALGYLIVSKFQSKRALLVLAVGTAVFTVLDARYLLFWMLAGFVVWMLKTPHRNAMGAVGLGVALLGVALYEFSATRWFSISVHLPQASAEFLICAGTILAIPLLCAAKTNDRLRILERPAKWLSAISFSLYLFHYPVLCVVGRWLPRSASISTHAFGFFALLMLITLVIVSLFYMAFERNTPRLRRYVNSRIRSRGFQKLAETVA